MDKIPNLNITIDTNTWKGLAQLQASFTLLDDSTNEKYHSVTNTVEIAHLNDGVIDLIALADRMMDIIEERNNSAISF